MAKPREIQGWEGRHGEGRGRKGSEEPRQAEEFSYNDEKSGITGGAVPCPISPQHTGIQAEICGMKIKLGGQLQ